jgi:hypothetical protein
MKDQTMQEDKENPIYSISPEQGVELRRLFIKAVDLNGSKGRSLANRLLYANQISHKALYYCVCQIVDATDEKLPSWVGDLFAIREAGLKGADCVK